MGKKAEGRKRKDYGRTTPGENGMISLLPIIIVIKTIDHLDF
jgi:hypothetical protein